MGLILTFCDSHVCLGHFVCSYVPQKGSSSHRRNFRPTSPLVCLDFLRLIRGGKLHKIKVFHCKLYRRQTDTQIPSYRKSPGANKIPSKSDPSFDLDIFCSDAWQPFRQFTPQIYCIVARLSRGTAESIPAEVSVSQHFP